MPPLFTTLTSSGDAASPKKRRNLLGRPAFFSRPSVASTASSTTTLVPLESTVSHPPAVDDKAPALPSNGSVDLNKLAGPANLIIANPSLPTAVADATEQLIVSLLPSALSNTSLGPGSAPTGPTPSNSIGGISASTSRNTVLPASHPILNSSVSTFLPPSLSLGFELQESAKALPTLASAIKLPSPARPEGGADPAEKIGAESIITRKPVPALSDIPTSQTAVPAPSLPAQTTITAGPQPSLPRSTSGTSIFGSSRLARMTSRSSIKPHEPEPSGKRSVSNGAAGAGGMSLGRRISRRLSIDGLRPMFAGASTKRKPETGREGGKLDIQRWAQGAASGCEAGEAPPIIPAGAEPEIAKEMEKPKTEAAKAKERLVLPNIRTWRNKFSTKAAPAPRPKPSTGGQSYTESVRSQKLDSWVDVGSVRSNLSGYAGTQGQQGSVRGSTRGMFGALKRMEAEGSPAISVVEASEPTGIEMNHMSPPNIPLPAEPAIPDASPLDPSARRSTELLDSLLAPELTTPDVPTVSAPSPPAPDVMSPANDDKTLLEPVHSPTPGLTEAPASDVPQPTEAEEIIRDVREAAAVKEDTVEGSTSTTSLTAGLPHNESGFSFHTAKSAPSSDDMQKTGGLTASLSKSLLDLSSSSSSLIEKTEREQGEGWWSAPRNRPVQTRSSFIAPRSEDKENILHRRRSGDPRRQSSPSVLPERRSIVGSVVAKLESANTAALNSPRRSILRPCKLQFADADEDGDDTPTRPSSRRAFKDGATDLARAGTPTSSRHRRNSTNDSFAHLFFGPVAGSSIAPRPTAAHLQLLEDFKSAKERHMIEMDAMIAALKGTKAENQDLRDRNTRLGRMLNEETDKRIALESKISSLQQILKEATGIDVAGQSESYRDSVHGHASVRRNKPIYDKYDQSSPARRRRGVRGDLEADEFGRLDGSPLDRSRR